MNLGNLGNLGGLGSLTKMFDVGGIVKDVVNGFLPKDMKVVGDGAGAFVDFKTGNFVGAVQHGLEAVKDLPQAAKALQGGNTTGAADQTNKRPELEPTPPPAASREGKPFDLGGLFTAIKKLTDLLTNLLGGAAGATSSKPDEGTKPAGTGTPPPKVNGEVSAKADAGAAAKAQGHETSSGGAHRNEKSSGDGDTWFQRAHNGADPSLQARSHAQASGWKGEPRTPAPAPAAAAHAAAAPAASRTGAAAPTPVADPPASPSPASSTSASGSAPAAAASKGQTITSLDQIKGMSDSAIRDAVINGRISPELAKDQTAMMVLQQRMNAISEMNNLMTAMMRALHDMQMAVIQNIRI